MRAKKYETEEERKEAKRRQSYESHKRRRQGEALRRNCKYKTEEERREARLQWGREWRQKNKDKIAEYKARYYEKNKELIKRKTKEWKEKNRPYIVKVVTDKDTVNTKILNSLVKSKREMSQQEKEARRARLPAAVREHVEALEKMRQKSSISL